VVVVGIIVVVLIVMPEFDSERDTVTGVLGVVIPAFATIGAAVVGITVGYSTGQSSGKEAGKAEGKAEVRPTRRRPQTPPARRAEKKPHGESAILSSG
jgi:hypothetical protein